MGSVLNICRRKSSSAESRSAESLLKGQTSLFNIEHNPVPCFFRALKQRLNIIKISVMYYRKKNIQNKDSKKGPMIFTLSSGRVHSRAQWGMSEFWYRWEGVGHCSLNSPELPTRFCKLKTTSLALEVHWSTAPPLTRRFHQVKTPPEKYPGKEWD